VGFQRLAEKENRACLARCWRRLLSNTDAEGARSVGVHLTRTVIAIGAFDSRFACPAALP
jgi:hypothetical protein